MLNIDQYFYEALKTDADIIEVTDGRIFNTARPDKDETEDRIPYIIITFDGATSDDDNKDMELAPLSHASVSVLCVAEDREGLADLTEMVYDAVTNSFDDDMQSEHEEWSFEITQCMPAASAVQMDEMKPCYFQTLTYQCDTQDK